MDTPDLEATNIPDFAVLQVAARYLVGIVADRVAAVAVVVIAVAMVAQVLLGVEDHLKKLL